MTTPIEVGTDFELSGGFCRLPNAFTRADHPLWQYPGAMQLWIACLELSHRKSKVIHGQEHLANLLGLKLGTFRKNLKTLRTLGYISDDYKLSLGIQVSRPEPAIEPQKQISEEVALTPKRKPTGLNQKQRWELIKKAWNDNKPDGYMQLDGSVILPLLIAIDTHTKRLNIDRDDYNAFIGSVLRGAASDSWWNAQPFKASNIFGFGSELENKKFENVERLYLKGSKTAPIRSSSTIDWASDESVLELAKDYETRQELTKVCRVRGRTPEIQEDLKNWTLDQRNIEQGFISNDNLVYLERLQRLQSANVEPKDEWIPGNVLLLVYEANGTTPITWTINDPLPR